MVNERETALVGVGKDTDGEWWLRGRALRFVLVDELMGRPSMTVKEMIEVVHAHGFELGGRASKIISDALRWELRRGRVVRIARGLYRYERAPVSTARRIRLFAATCRQWLVAPRRIYTPRQTPTADQGGPLANSESERRVSAVDEPPWLSLVWLWSR